MIDPETEIMVELEPAAVMVLIDEDEIALALGSPRDALGPLRLALATASDGSPERGVIYRLWIRREQVDELQRYCERAAPTFRGLPQELDRERGRILEAAGGDLAEALRLARGRPPDLVRPKDEARYYGEPKE